MQGQLGVAFRLSDDCDLPAVRVALRAAGLPSRLPRMPGEHVFIEVGSADQQDSVVQALAADRAFLDVHPALRRVRACDG